MRSLLLLSAGFLSACAPGLRETRFISSHSPGRGEISIHSPKGIDANQTPRPLLVVLHGYGASPRLQRLYFRFEPYVAEKNFHLVYLPGSLDRENKRFWNATPSCCDLDGSGVDDVAFIDRALQEIRNLVPVSRVYVAGHSNGGFMALRLACELGAKIDGVFALAAADENRRCVARDYSGFRAVLAHGTDDTVIAADGGSFRGLKRHGTTEETRAIWRKRLGCEARTTESRRNHTYGVWGHETQLVREECADRNRLVSMTIEKGSHLPWITPEFRRDVLDALLDE